MNKILLVLQREYLQIVKTKLFIISTLLTPLLMAGILLVPMLLTQFKTGKPEKIAVVDNTDLSIYEELKKQLEDDSLKPGYELYKEKYNLYEQVEGLEKLKERVLSRELDGFILVEKDILENGNISYYSKNVANFSTQKILRDTVNRIVLVNRFKALDIDEGILEKNLKNIDFQVIKVTKEGETLDKGQGFIISYVFMLLIYMTILMYGVSVLRGVIQEKTSRVIEVVISNVKPFQLLMGKVLGIGLVGLTQYVVWLLLGYFFFNNITSFSGKMGFAGEESPLSADMINIPFSVFLYFVIFFILGYFLYSTLYAAIGSMVDNEQEANSIQTPLVMFLVVPMLLMPMVIQSPDSTISVILSLFPFFAPILMFLRITVMQPPLWQILLSIALLVLAIIISTFIASKIYRVGILMYGKKANFKDIIKWMRYK